MKIKYHIPTSMTRNFFRIVIVLFVIALFIYNAAAVPPVLSISTNSKTGTALPSGIFINTSEAITVTASTTDAGNTWHWYIDNVPQVNINPFQAATFTSGSYHYITVNSSNVDGYSNTIYWGINVYPAMATTADYIQLLNETPANNIASAIHNNSLPELVNVPLQIYINVMGLFFYAFVWFIAFGMLWIKQKSIDIPATVGVIFGGVIITFLPPQYQLVSEVFIVFGIFAVIYIFFKGRG